MCIYIYLCLNLSVYIEFFWGSKIFAYLFLFVSIFVFAFFIDIYIDLNIYMFCMYDMYIYIYLFRFTFCITGWFKWGDQTMQMVMLRGLPQKMHCLGWLWPCILHLLRKGALRMRPCFIVGLVWWNILGVSRPPIGIVNCLCPILRIPLAEVNRTIRGTF